MSLASAAAAGDVEEVSRLLSTGSEGVNCAREEDGSTPLLLAALGAHVDVLGALLAAGAEVNKVKPTGATALFAAAASEGSPSEAVECVEALLSAGGDVDLPNLHGVTPLQTAAHKGHAEVCVVLLRGGATPEAADKAGNTALHKAARSDAVEAVEAILATVRTLDGGDERVRQLLALRNHDGQTALELGLGQPLPPAAMKLLVEERRLRAATEASGPGGARESIPQVQSATELARALRELTLAREELEASEAKVAEAEARAAAASTALMAEREMAIAAALEAQRRASSLELEREEAVAAALKAKEERVAMAAALEAERAAAAAVLEAERAEAAAVLEAERMAHSSKAVRLGVTIQARAHELPAPATEEAVPIARHSLEEEEEEALNATDAFDDDASDFDAEAPPGWIKFVDSVTGVFYYVHGATGRSQWERPAPDAPPPPPLPRAMPPPPPRTPPRGAAAIAERPSPSAFCIGSGASAHVGFPPSDETLASGAVLSGVHVSREAVSAAFGAGAYSLGALERLCSVCRDVPHEGRIAGGMGTSDTHALRHGDSVQQPPFGASGHTALVQAGSTVVQALEARHTQLNDQLSAIRARGAAKAAAAAKAAKTFCDTRQATPTSARDVPGAGFFGGESPSRARPAAEHETSAHDATQQGSSTRDAAEQHAVKTFSPVASSTQAVVTGERAEELAAEATQLFRANKFAQAKSVYLQAMTLHESLPPVERTPKDEQQLAVLCNNLAATLEKLGSLREAERLYVRALNICSQHMLPDDPRIAHIRGKLDRLKAGPFAFLKPSRPS